MRVQKQPAAVQTKLLRSVSPLSPSLSSNVETETETVDEDEDERRGDPELAGELRAQVEAGCN